MNNRVHPIFDGVLSSISEPQDKAPEGNGLVVHPTLGLCHEPQEFDEWDDALMHDVCEGPTLAKPIQALLITYAQIKLSHASFGEDFTNNKAALDALMPLLKELRKAVREKWEQGQ
jgi:hypothetical protein